MGWTVAREAGCPVLGGHTIDDPEPKYGMAVTGVARPRPAAAQRRRRAGLPLTLTKPLGVGRAQQPAQGRPARCSRRRSRPWPRSTATPRERRWRAGVRAATDVTGFGLLGHLFKMARASGVGAVIDAAAVPCLDGARATRCATGSSAAAPGATWTGCARTCGPHGVDRGRPAAARRRADLRRAARGRRAARATRSSAVPLPAAASRSADVEGIAVVRHVPARRDAGAGGTVVPRVPPAAQPRVHARVSCRGGRAVSRTRRRIPRRAERSANRSRPRRRPNLGSAVADHLGGRA